MASKRTSIVLCLIRCGDTSWSADRRVQGSADLPLSEDGRSSVTDSAARHAGGATGTVFHPADEAATETARIYAEAWGIRTREVVELADPGLGLLEGLTEQVFAERYPKRHKQWEDDPVSLAPPEGEDIAEARARIYGAVAKQLRRAKSDQVSVVLHPLGLGFLRCWLADRPGRDLWELLQDRPRVERYALTMPMIQWLEEAASAVTTRT